MKGEDCDLGGAVEAEGQADGADATVDVELHLVEAVVAFGVFLAHGGQDERAEEGKPDLAAVGVAGEHEVDERAAGVGDDGVGVVGLVGHEDDGAVGFGGDGEIEVRAAGAGVVQAAEPDARAVAFDGDVLVDQDGDAMAGKGVNDHGGVDGYVVVAEDGVAQGAVRLVMISAQRWAAWLPAMKVMEPWVTKSPVRRTRSGARALTLLMMCSRK